MPESARSSVLQGNELYAEGDYQQAINKYDEALIEMPQALEPKFNKANAYYRFDDLSNAMELYKEVAAKTKDMSLVARSRYNLGNANFLQGIKQKDSNLQKALESLEAGIRCWRNVLDIEPENEKAAKNIEVARLIIKDIIDQLNKQREQREPNQPHEPNQTQQQQQEHSQAQEPNQMNQQQQGSTQEPNQPQEPNQLQQQEQQRQYQQDQAAPDTTADDILDKEQQQQKMRQILQRPQWEKVEMDW